VIARRGGETAISPISREVSTEVNKYQGRGIPPRFEEEENLYGKEEKESLFLFLET